jgi:hypothetical protein
MSRSFVVRAVMMRSCSCSASVDGSPNPEACNDDSLIQFVPYHKVQHCDYSRQVHWATFKLLPPKQLLIKKRKVFLSVRSCNLEIKVQ